MRPEGAVGIIASGDVAYRLCVKKECNVLLPTQRLVDHVLRPSVWVLVRIRQEGATRDEAP